MNADDILRRYAQLQSEMEAQSHLEARALSALSAGSGGREQMVAHWRGKIDHAQPRKSRVREIEESLRRKLFSLPEDERKPALEAMQALLDELAAAEHGLDSFRFAFDWSRGERPTCPCGPMAECPLLFTEIGYGEDQQPGDRATPEELARCPLQARRELVLWGAAPKEHFWEWWQRRKGEPARGRLFWMNAEGIGWPVDIVEGKTVGEMMRRARRMLHAWVARKGERGETGEVFLMLTTLDKAGGSR